MRSGGMKVILCRAYLWGLFEFLFVAYLTLLASQVSTEMLNEAFTLDLDNFI